MSTVHNYTCTCCIHKHTRANINTHKHNHIKGAMTRYAHTIRLPMCMVSLGPCAKLLVQETKAYTLLKPYDCILDRHIAMVSVFRSLAFCDSESAHKTLLCATCQNVGTCFLCTLQSSKPRASLGFETIASQSLECARLHAFQWQVQRKFDQ